MPFQYNLQDLLTRVDDFQQRSERLLSDESPSPLELQDLLDVSLGLDVELPQLPLLRVRLEQARWLEAVQQASSWPDSLCLDTMRRLIDQGVGLAPHSSVERAMARLQELLTVSEQWEERVLSLIEARCVCSFLPLIIHQPCSRFLGVQTHELLVSRET